MINILDEMNTDFLVYAQEVNQNRAFPDSRDGLKPSQRAALYTMFRKGYSSDKPHVKSAKITGAIIGELWPHGDSSAYESIVRMSQNWVNNIPEIDFHGANGSLQGGPEAASSRYTEARLSNASEDGFFNSIKKDTVDMIPNFSEDDEWPSVFPSIFPRLYVNGSTGIGYTIAQEWEPHNLLEIYEKVKEYVETGKITSENIYPDFPTGGIIINKSELHNIYKTGRGAIILRGLANIEGKYIRITELPYQVYAEPFIQTVKDLVNNGNLSGIEDICNKSGDNGLLIEIECSENSEKILKQLYKQTDLQTTFNANQMALVNGVPQLLNLQEYIKIYVDHNINCLQREYKYDLNKASERKEIVDGLLKAISDIDNIISCIKSSKSSEIAKEKLIKIYGFSDSQAKAIIDMKLGKLANLESNELIKEQEELIKIINKCNKFLASNKLQTTEFLNRLAKFTEKYGWERRTKVIDLDLTEENKIVREKTVNSYMITLTAGNNIKKVLKDNYKQNSKTISDADKPINTVELTDKDRLILISSKGLMYKINVNKINTCSNNATGQPLTDFINEKIVNIYSGNESEKYLFMITKCGMAKKIEASTVFSVSKCVGAPVMKVNETDEIIYCVATDSSKITLNNGKKDKEINTDDFITKGRSAGGVVAYKVKPGVYITIR